MKASTLREKTCFFTGHRDIPRELYPEVGAKLQAAVERLMGEGVCYFATGVAIGFDTLAALTILKLKRQYSHIRLILILPCQDHDSIWLGEDKSLFEKIKDRADKVVYTSERYHSGCMNKRSRVMAENSGWAICYVERPTGGAAYAVNYAKSMGVEVINLAAE